MEAVSKKYVKLDHVEHVRTRPNMYIGSTRSDAYDAWVLDDADARMEKKTIDFVPGLFKIFDEILVNAIDHEKRLKQAAAETKHHVRNIKVDIDRSTGVIQVCNDGDGIDVVLHPEHGVYVPELIFAHLLSGTNYDDEEERFIGGQNGLGAKVASIFSTFFEIETVDAERGLHYLQRFEDNMRIILPPKIKKCGKKPFTTVRFRPDFALFGADGLSHDMYKIMEKRVYDACAATGKDVAVSFNGVKLQYKDFERYTDLFLGAKADHARAYEALDGGRWQVAASFNDSGGFEQVSFVNGIWTIRGGKHVDCIVQQIVKRLSESVSKRKKDLVVKPATVRDNLIVFVNATIPNPEFDSQCKETLTTPVAKFGGKPELSDRFIDKLCKTGIVERIIEVSQVQDKKSLSKTDGKKRSMIRGIPKLEDANWAGTAKSKECTLVLTEGDSAASTAIAGLSEIGRDRYGVFPLKGKILNVKDQTIRRVSENEEIVNLKKILGLESGKVYDSTHELRYGRIMIMTDQDTDGWHIRGLLFNLFHTLWPSLIRVDRFICSMMTPIVKATKAGGRETLSFYNLTEFERWNRNEGAKGWTIKYYKGLGTSTSKEARQYFQELKVLDYVYDETTSADRLDLAFNKKRADDRKRWIEAYDRSKTLDYDRGRVTYEDFVDRELIHFSNYDVERSIPSLCDGLKVSQRKILYACFRKGLQKSEIKVAQLSGYVSEVAAYHHGEASLQGAIVNMAQDFAGSNNINLLVPNGQFGTRRCGGKDAASPRYIYTKLNKVTSSIFIKEDAGILTYLEDDGQTVEPEYYVPIIPMVLINGAAGIGTGFSTSVPCFDPKDVIDVLKRMLRGEDVTDRELVPWWRGFTGTIEKRPDGKYVSRGRYRRLTSTSVEIVELPVGTWTQDFKETLEAFVEKGVGAKSYESHCTDVTVRFVLHFSGKDALDDLLVVDPSTGHAVLEMRLGLVSTKMLGLNNMYLFNEHGRIQKYATPIDIIRAFYDVRLRFYEKRKVHVVDRLKKEAAVLADKIRFLTEVVDGKLPIQRMNKADLESALEVGGYAPVEGGFDHLTRMPVYQLTMDKVQDLVAERDGVLKVLAKTEGTSAQAWWESELNDVHL